jgi:hypothetical protein
MQPDPLYLITKTKSETQAASPGPCLALIPPEIQYPSTMSVTPQTQRCSRFGQLMQSNSNVEQVIGSSFKSNPNQTGNQLIIRRF